jgi:hypothetical protein
MANKDKISEYMKVIAEALENHLEHEDKVDPTDLINALLNFNIKLCKSLGQDPSDIFFKAANRTAKNVSELKH